MNKILCFFLLFIFNNLFVNGQEKHDFEMRKVSTVYVEFFGNSASFFSLNYDRIIKQYEMGYFNTSIGIAPVIYYGTGFNIPISINYSYGEKKGHLELGLGLGLNRAFGENINIDYTRLLANARIGYKYQKTTGGLFLKAGFTPIVPVYYFHGALPKGTLADVELIIFNPFSFGIGYSF